MPPRYCLSRPLPPYSYVSGLSPHPTSDPRGHSFGHAATNVQPLDPASWSSNADYSYAIDLFNHGYYWEAHEAWESLWHAAGRRGDTADFLKGLIKLAAAGVKAREGRAAGVRQHARRAEELFGRTASSAIDSDGAVFGLCLANLIEKSLELAGSAERLAGDGSIDAKRELPVILRPL